MIAGQSAAKAELFAKRARDQFLAWSEIAGQRLRSLSKLRLTLSAGIKRHFWIIFAIVLVGNIIAFNYYQARISRYYLGIMLFNLTRIIQDIDALDAKLNQLSTKIDDLSAKIDKRPLLPSAISVTTPPTSILAKPRSKQ